MSERCASCGLGVDTDGDGNCAVCGPKARLVVPRTPSPHLADDLELVRQECREKEDGLIALEKELDAVWEALGMADYEGEDSAAHHVRKAIMNLRSELESAKIFIALLQRDLKHEVETSRRLRS